MIRFLASATCNLARVQVVKRTSFCRYSSIKTPGERLVKLRRENEIHDILRKINAPEIVGDVIKNEIVHGIQMSESGAVSFALQPSASQEIQQLCEEAIKSLDWVSTVESTRKYSSSAQTPKSKGPQGLRDVRFVVGVTSCKGGVGKSTVALNLAYQLNMDGLSVGLLDADIYGPSLPTMISPTDDKLYKTKENLIQPIVHDGVVCMSYGFSSQGKKAAMIRGPMVSGIISQLATGTDWGKLDVLVVDMPPGTGDIHITLGQQVAMDAAIVVSTPHILSVVDVAKGIELMGTLKVPTIALVENMSYFECPNCSSQHQIFGESGTQALAEQFGIPRIYKVPIHASSATNMGKKMPLVLVEKTPDSVKEVYKNISEGLLSELNRKQEDAPSVTFDPSLGVMIKSGSSHGSVNAAKLRISCMCAQCVDEITGKRLIKTTHPNIQALGISKKGNYAVEIEWSDGHSSIFPFKKIWEMSEQ
eukprot:m.202207 g.202207  ORF g.202207 m.202207 type:complete len:476 (-) comp15750_c0_seq11:1667-3094(-)